MGGGKEKQRSCRFLEKVVVVPDGPILQNLKIGGKIKKRSLVGTLNYIKEIIIIL